jgi:predicted enzyme related to lactoylglutathione lyase
VKNNPRLTFVALSVSDLKESVNFYHRILGVPLQGESHDEELNDPWYGGEHAAYSWTQGAFIHFALYPSHLPERPVTTAAQIGFHLEDFEGIHKAAVASGVKVVQQPRQEPWGFTARYLDPDGNIVSITKLEKK